MILTIDVGNSRIKWALWQASKIIARGTSAYMSGRSAEQQVAALDELFSVIQKPQRVFVVCVAGGSLCPVLDDWVRQNWQLDAEYLKTEKRYKNIVNAYDKPEQHGADRWAGIVAAHLCSPDTSLCVIGAGTAITFDFVDKSGQHLGGYILPSYATMHAALIADTAKVESSSNMQYHELGIPDNTDDAVNQGLHKLIQAGIREFCQLAQDEMDQPMQIILTGGFAKTILEYPYMPAMQYSPDLVMQGLYEIMMQRKS